MWHLRSAYKNSFRAGVQSPEGAQHPEGLPNDGNPRPVSREPLLVAWWVLTVFLAASEAEFLATLALGQPPRWDTLTAVVVAFALGALLGDWSRARRDCPARRRSSYGRD
jgi:hypothetical protein